MVQKNTPVDRVIQKSTIKYTLPQEERNQKPVCDVYRDSVYAFCNHIPILRWGIGPEGETQAIRNCNNDANRGRWGKCGYIFDNNRDFMEGNEVDIKGDPKFDSNAR